MPNESAKTLFALCVRTLSDGGLTATGLEQLLLAEGQQELLQEANKLVQDAARAKAKAFGLLDEERSAEEPEALRGPTHRVWTAEQWWKQGDWVLGIPFGREVRIEGVRGIAGEEGRVVRCYWRKPTTDEQGVPIIERVSVLRRERPPAPGMIRLPPLAEAELAEAELAEAELAELDNHSDTA